VGSSAAVHAAAEVDESLRTFDESGEQVRRDDVDGHDVRATGEASVVDDCVNWAELVDAIGDSAALVHVGQVPDDRLSAAVEERVDGSQPLAAAGVHHRLVAFAEQGPGGRSAQAVS
jgi:hypothetical protein